jgi:hypothetical protein
VVLMLSGISCPIEFISMKLLSFQKKFVKNMLLGNPASGRKPGQKRTLDRHYFKKVLYANDLKIKNKPDPEYCTFNFVYTVLYSVYTRGSRFLSYNFLQFAIDGKNNSKTKVEKVFFSLFSCLPMRK